MTWSARLGTEERTCHGVVLAKAVDDEALVGVSERRLTLLPSVRNSVINLIEDEHDALLMAELACRKLRGMCNMIGGRRGRA